MIDTRILRVLQWAGAIHTRCGELAQAEDLFRRSLNLCIESGFPAIRASNTICLGLVSVLRGQPQAGLEQIRRGMQSWLGLIPRAYEQHYMAVALAAAGKPDEAFATLIPAVEFAEQGGQVNELSDMHMLKGHLLEGKPNSKEAENSFRTSIEIARLQNAKSLELRATTSLARFLAKQGRCDEARAMLADIYNWFTEGFDTADLKEAKALLDELNNSP